MSSSPDTPASARVPLSKKILWGIGGAADNTLYNGLTLLILPIFNIGLGLDAAKVGFALAVPRILDAVIDPMVGNFSDNLRTRWGRRRPMIFGGVLAASLLFGLLFSPPRTWSLEQLLWWIFVVGALFHIVYAFFVIPYSALGLEISDDYNERTKVLAWRMYLGLTSALALPWVYKLCFALGANEAEGAREVGWLLAGTAACLGIIPALFVKERPTPVVAGHTGLPFFKSVAITFRNRSFVTLAICSLCILFSLFIASPLGNYINSFYLYHGDKKTAANLIGVCQTLTSIGGLFGLPFGAWLSARIGKRHALIGLLVASLVIILLTWWMFTPRLPWLAAVPAFFGGLCLFASFLTGLSMLGDICDADELETGLRREGMYSASLEFGKKLAIAASTALSGCLVDLIGFNPKISVQSEHTVQALRVGYIALGILPLLLAILSIRFYPLTHQRVLEIHRRLAARPRSGIGN